MKKYLLHHYIDPLFNYFGSHCFLFFSYLFLFCLQIVCSIYVHWVCCLVSFLEKFSESSIFFLQLLLLKLESRNRQKAYIPQQSVSLRWFGDVSPFSRKRRWGGQHFDPSTELYNWCFISLLHEDVSVPRTAKKLT